MSSDAVSATIERNPSETFFLIIFHSLSRICPELYLR
jgi:hypothetical protein